VKTRSVHTILFSAVAEMKWLYQPRFHKKLGTTISFSNDCLDFSAHFLLLVLLLMLLLFVVVVVVVVIVVTVAVGCCWYCVCVAVTIAVAVACAHATRRTHTHTHAITRTHTDSKTQLKGWYDHFVCKHLSRFTAASQHNATVSLWTCNLHRRIATNKYEILEK
jgi:hypothetical protein